jgi:hypothetical protein
MRVHISYIQGAYFREYEHEYVPQLSKELRECDVDSSFVLEADPARADTIILWEGFEYKTPDYIQTLENDPLIREHAERVYCLNYEDHPEGFLAGIYTSLEHPFFDPAWHRIWPFFLMNNQQVYGLTRDEVQARNPKLLFSFTGAASHQVRKNLFALFSKGSPEYHVEHVKKWYNHDDGDRSRFLKIALDSTFCLCPHGYCAYTPRITEVMAMARVPVIIADDWIPFSFEDQLPYYIKVAEKDIEHLPDILSSRRLEAEELSRNARMLWDKYLSVKRRAVGVIVAVAKLATQPGGRMNYADYRERWHSKKFLTQAGWTRRQQLALRVEQHARRWFPSVKIPGVSPLMRYRNAPNMK